MHRDNGPGDHAGAGDLQVLAGRELDLRGVVQKFFLHPGFVVLPAVVGERSDIEENQAAVLGVELRGSVRGSGAPSSAKAVDQFPEGSVIGGFLLRASANKSDQGAKDR